MTRPLIAVPAYWVKPGRVKGWDDAAVATPARYLEALRRAGGQEALLMPVELDEEGEAEEVLSHFDGLLLIGGGDLEPARYGQEPHERVYGVLPERDAFEITLARAAVERELPLLAICRGHQVLDVALGGTLEQDLTVEGHGVPGQVNGATRHAVTVTVGSRLARAMRAEHAVISSHHHQAVDELGDGLIAVAWADDGTVEGVELDGPGWVIGTQWHPEDTAAEDPSQQALFNELVARSRR